MVEEAVLYAVLIGSGGLGLFWVFRLKEGYGAPFLRAFRAFILVSFAYAAASYLGEIILPGILPPDQQSLTRGYMAVDLITIPLLGGIFYLLFLWIVRLFEKRASRAARFVFFAVEALFLVVFALSFASYFGRGLSAWIELSVLVLNGIVILLLGSAVLILLTAVPESRDPDRRVLARRLGGLYAAAFAVLGIALSLPLLVQPADPKPFRVAVAACLFLINIPALVFLRKFSKTRVLDLSGRAPDGTGPAGAIREAGLTEREWEIVRLVAQGLDNREIGKRLFISPKTVKNNMTGIYAKTGARNRVQLANLTNRSNQVSGTGPGKI
jgi:DNA-binding CsgD family transcriptional regulator